MRAASERSDASRTRCLRSPRRRLPSATRCPANGTLMENADEDGPSAECKRTHHGVHGPAAHRYRRQRAGPAQRDGQQNGADARPRRRRILQRHDPRARRSTPFTSSTATTSKSISTPAARRSCCGGALAKTIVAGTGPATIKIRTFVSSVARIKSGPLTLHVGYSTCPGSPRGSRCRRAHAGTSRTR